MTNLVIFNELEKQIVISRDVNELLKIHDKLELIRIASKQQKGSISLINKAQKYKIKIEQRIGEEYKNLENKSGKRKDLVNQIDEVTTKQKAKEVIEKSRETISKWVKESKINQKTIDKYEKECNEQEIEMSGEGLLKFVKEIKKEKDRKEKITAFKEASKKYKEEEDIKIIEGDFREANITENSIDLIITDPPYPQEFLNLWEALFDEADRVLKPSKFLICYSNHQNLDKIFRLKNDLIYYWIFKLDFTAKPIAMGRNLIATWKPVLVYQKQPFRKIEETIEDNVKEYSVFKPSERDMHDKNWAQSLGKFEYLIDKFSKPNELIYDPFVGTGTTIIAAKNMKRRCIGVEIEKKYISLIKGRLIDGI